VLTKRMCFVSDAQKTSLQRSNRAMPGRSAVTPDVKRTGRGARESVWIGPAPRHAPSVQAAGRGFYLADWAMPSRCGRWVPYAGTCR
jgi:hypothetical protein